ncbi:hypothetical protein [Mucilaginibacter sp.]
MEELDDESIQRIVEAQLNNPTGSENDGGEAEELYRLIFNELNNDAITRLEFALPENVLYEIQLKLEKKEAIAYRLVYTVILIWGILLLCLSMLLINSSLINILNSFFKDRQAAILFIICLFITIRLGDRIFSHHKIKEVVL